MDSYFSFYFLIKKMVIKVPYKAERVPVLAKVLYVARRFGRTIRSKYFMQIKE